ncbi:hypothetical protein M426DRAFT_76417 [Hypoxylon sp. CI-4A]|nr:hypothetical protein M426DRAFT_76417 [Hypoxylon sp. CI-4A]
MAHLIWLAKLSLALGLRARNYDVTTFDRYKYDETDYQPGVEDQVQAASVDFDKIAWMSINEAHKGDGKGHDNGSGPANGGTWGARERNLTNMEKEGLRDTQFVKSSSEDRGRAKSQGWDSKLLDFNIPDTPTPKTFEAVLDSLAGYTKSSEACSNFHKLAVAQGVKFQFGHEQGYVESIVDESTGTSGGKRAVGIKTRDGAFHRADIFAVAAGSFSTQLLPNLAYHLESSGGSVGTLKIDSSNHQLWDKYAPCNFPVITWKSAKRSADGEDIGSVYVFPRTEQGLIKIGYRGIKFTNFQPAPEGVPFTQHNQWSIPLGPEESKAIPQSAIEAIRTFISILLPKFKDAPFHSTKLCWYTDTLDNSFLVDYVPTYPNHSVFICTGGSGHGAKFLPVLGDHVADILQNGDESSSYMRPFWRWRDNIPRGNGLEEGPEGPRNLGTLNGYVPLDSPVS